MNSRFRVKRTGVRWRPLMTMLVAMTMLFVLAAPGLARPLRGSPKWSILLCRFTDTTDGGTALNHTADYYRNMFLNRFTGGLTDYLHDVSYGSLDFAGSEVRGWYNLGISVTQGQQEVNNSHNRFAVATDCVNAAHNTDNYQVPSGNRLAVITFPSFDMFGWNGGAFLPWNVDVGGMAHEVGHGIGLNHSFSDDPTWRDADGAAIEYDDPWDVMSWGNAFRVATPFGDGPVGLTGFHLDRMGWLQRSRILTFGANGATTQTVTLAALNHPEASGYMLVRIPFDPGDLNHYYTVEYRSKTGWDAGIPDQIVLINEVKKRDDGVYYAFLLRERSGDRNPITSLNANGVQIQINSMDAGAHQASVTITADIVGRCLQGWVWREARPSDHVCVMGETRSDTQQENALADSRRDPNGGPYGPDTCLSPFVWREAYSGDHVCVPINSRTRAQRDNAAAADRSNPARLVYGPNTCVQDYVWREADDRDWVCVTVQTRSDTQQENALAASRRNPHGGPYGPDTCLDGYVWREAFPGDHVCVTRDSRTRAQQDNAAAESRLLYP